MVIKGVNEDAQMVWPVEHGPADHICKNGPREICTALLMSGVQGPCYALHCSLRESNKAEALHDYTCKEFDVRAHHALGE